MYKLPKKLYDDMLCRNEKNYHSFFYNYYRHEFICNDEYKYITIEFVGKRLTNKIWIIDIYRISFRDFYRLSRIDGETIYNYICRDDWDGKYNGFNIYDSDGRYQEFIDRICETLHKRKYKYDLFASFMSRPNQTNTISTEHNDRSELFPDSTINGRCIEYICEDLNFEELDAIIYPDEYKNFEYEKII